MDLVLVHDTAVSYGKTDQKYQTLPTNTNNREPRRNTVLMQKADAGSNGVLERQNIRWGENITS